MSNNWDMNAIAEEAKNLMPVEVADPGNDPGQLAPEPEPEPIPVAEVEPVTPPSPPSPPVPPQFTTEQLETYKAYEQLDQRLRSDPEFAQRFRQAFDPPAPVTPPPPAPSDRYVDPDVQALQSQVAQQAEAVRMLQASLNRQNEIENVAQMERAKTSFKTAHSLDDTQMTRVYDEAQKYAGALQTLYTQGVDQQTALSQVFSAAYWNMPDMQQHELDRKLAELDADKTRKAKASSLSSGSGSAPRTSEGPKTEQQRRDAMSRDLAEVFGNFKE